MSSPTKIDLKRELGPLYKARAKPALVEVPELSFLMLDGHGDPNTEPAYTAAIEALYTVSYTAKFMLKAQRGLDYGVMPLEGLWWSGQDAGFDATHKTRWDWTMMIAQPEFLDDELVARAVEQARERKPLPAIELIRHERFHEGLSAQVLYVGPFAAEGPTIAALHAHIAEQGYELRGKHHEIYLSDPRRTAPEKLRTIIRQPVLPPAE